MSGLYQFVRNSGTGILDRVERNLEAQGNQVVRHFDPDAAYEDLSSEERAGLVVIQHAMIGNLGDSPSARYQLRNTGGFFDTGVVLLEDLCGSNPDLFPKSAVLFTIADPNTEVGQAARELSKRLDVPLIDRSYLFSDDVVQRLGELYSERVESS